VPSNTWGSFPYEVKSWEKIDGSTVLKAGSLYTFKLENQVGTALGFLSPNDAADALLNTERIKNEYLEAFEKQTGEQGEVVYVFASYEKMAGAGFGRWIFNGVNIFIVIRDHGSVTAALIIIALAAAFLVIALTLTGVWLVFKAVEAGEKIGDAIKAVIVGVVGPDSGLGKLGDALGGMMIPLVLLGGAGLLVYVYIKSKRKTKLGVKGVEL